VVTIRLDLIDGHWRYALNVNESGTMNLNVDE
jgi:hypothetical protein